MVKNWFAQQGDAFQNIERSDGQLLCAPFLRSAQSFTTILDTQLSPLFSPIKERFSNNVRQMSDVWQAHPECETMHELIRDEMARGECDLESACASRGLLWFTRACQFFVEAVERNLRVTEEPLVTSFRQAYNDSLARHHSPIVKPLFSIAMTICPTRETFYKQLCNDDNLETALKDANTYLGRMCRVKDRLVQYCRYRQWDVSFKDESPDIYVNARKRKLEAETNGSEGQRQSKISSVAHS